jgi:iron complex transport system permease protein
MERKIVLLFLLVCIVFVLSIAMLLYGKTNFSLSDLLHITPENKSDYFILYDLRLPRLISSLYCGMLFALSGSIFQVVHHNPVASPDLLGVNATSIFTLLLFSNLFGSEHGLFVYALLGAIIGFGLTLTLATRHKKIDAARLIIIGISISILFKAFSQLLVIQSKESIHSILHFLNGTLYQVSWESVGMASYPTLICITMCLFCARYLDVMALSPDSAKSIGMKLEFWQIFFIGLALVMSATAISTCGSLGFIGLIAPNIARLLLGYSHRYTLWASLLIGCILVLGSDLISRMMFYPLEIPTGIILIFIGTPIFIFLLKNVNRYHYG